MLPHPLYRQSFLWTLACVGALGVVLVAVWLSPALQFRLSTNDTVALHTLLETASIAVSVMVFAASWHAIDRASREVRALTLASTAFAAVALLDFVHTMSYQGMPAFITPTYPGKAIGFFLAARLIAALALLLIAFAPPLRAFRTSARWLVLLGTLLAAGIVVVIGLFHPELMPAYLVPGKGQTAAKVQSEYVIVALNLAAAVVFHRRMRSVQPYPVVPLFAASLVMAQSELFFTLYATTTDQFIHLAHVHKVIAYFLIYRAIFVKSIRAPFDQLRATESELRLANTAISEQRSQIASVVESAMDAIVTVDEQLAIVVFNQAAVSMFGRKREEVFGRHLETLIPQRFHAAHLPHMRRFALESVTTRSMGRLGDVMALRADGSEFPVEASISRVLVEGRMLFTVIMRDISARVVAERRIARLTSLYSALAKTNETIVRLADWQALCDAVCRIIVTHGGVAAAVIRVPDAAAGTLRLFAHFGVAGGRIGGDAVVLTEAANPLVLAFREGRVRLVADILTEASMARSHGAARAHGLRSAVLVPLMSGSASIGILSVVASEVGHFDAEFAQLLAGLARDLVFARDKLLGEKTLRESEERFRALTAMASDWYWETDAEHRMTRISDSFEANTEGAIPVALFLGKTRWSSGSIDSDTPDMRAHRATVEAHLPFRDFEYRRVDAAGRVQIAAISGEPVFDAAGAFTGYRGVGRLVTAQRLAEHALVASEAHYRALVEASPYAIRVICEGRVVMANAAYQRLLRAPGVAALIGRDAASHMPAQWLAQGVERLRRVIEDRQPSAPQAQEIRRDDGDLVPVEVLTLPFTYGDKPAALSILSDLSERQASQRALEEAGRRYASLVESSSSGVVLLGGDIIEYANAGFARMLGFAAPADVVGSDMLMLTMPDFRRRVRHGILRLGSGLRQVQPPAQIRLRRQDGTLIDVQVSASAITLAGRTLIQAELRDITRERAAFAQIRALNRTLEARIAERTGELTTANRELEATNRDLESFSYSVAHDLRAPLRSMMGFAQLLELDVASDSFEELPRHVARISKSAVRMNALIDGLLAVARVTHGVLAEDKVASAALVAEAIRELRPAGHVRFDIGGLPAVRGDTAALRQVWSNLISNAVKYSARAAQPEISVACDKSAGELVFRVSDNGAGFDPAHSARLFGVFQRLHGSGEFEGTGVGLAIVRRIVERHGGRCWAEGRPGAGASFYFALPAARAVSGTA